jgi:hypothetical protein
MKYIKPTLRNGMNGVQFGGCYHGDEDGVFCGCGSDE